jgi:hypothetical protein
MTTYTCSPGGVNSAISLNRLIMNIVEDTFPVAVLHHTRVVNEVSKNLLLGAGADQLTDVLEELLLAVIQQSREGDIHITAERFKDTVLVYIQERNNYNGYALSFSVGSVSQDAARLGGHISIDGATRKQATISFSFPVHFAA